MNYFKLFGLEQAYIIDQSLVQNTYLDLQTKYHPDKAKNDIKRQEYLTYSMQINEAFKILQDDYLRAEYLLKLKGKILAEQELKNLILPNELEQILEEHELVENTNDLATLRLLEAEKSAKKKLLAELIGKNFAQNNIQQVLDLVVRLKYLTNLLDTIRLKIKYANP